MTQPGDLEDSDLQESNSSPPSTVYTIVEIKYQEEIME
jgi:hypothetical protein